MARSIADAALDAADRALPWVVPAYASVAWIGGGPTVDATAMDEVLQLLALPVLLLACTALLLDPPRARLTRAAVVVAALVACVPLLQLLPLPAASWGWGDFRPALALDLQAAGVARPRAWTLVPDATERSLYALLPALACMFGALALGPARVRRLPILVLVLVLANLAFGVFQGGLPDDSPLRLYRGNGSGIGGVLVNGNHQGTALAIGMVLGIGLWARERLRGGGSRLSPKGILYAGAAGVCLVAVPLTGSSGAMVIAATACAVALVATGIIHPFGGGLRRGAVAAGMLVALAIGLLLALQWMRLAQADLLRRDMALATLEMGGSLAPLGSGAGTFVEIFAQSGAPVLQRAEYINHAHNEFVQWWMEGGVPAMLVLVLGLGVVAWLGWRALRSGRHHPVAATCWLAVIVALAHSWVDFPLRTLSLMSICALLCGVALALVAGQRTLAQASRPVSGMLPSG